MDAKLSPGRLIQLLNSLAHGWNDDYLLFPYADRLYLVQTSTGKILWDSRLILADSSKNPTFHVDNKGNQFIEW